MDPKTPPDWWTSDVPEIISQEFNRKFVERFLGRHGKAPIKAVLLMQSGFSGIGNWMADEILWRARIHPATPAGKLTARQRDVLFRATKFVARESLRTLGKDNSDPPRSWLIHQKWKPKTEFAPRDHTRFRHARYRRDERRRGAPSVKELPTSLGRDVDGDLVKSGHA